MSLWHHRKCWSPPLLTVLEGVGSENLDAKFFEITVFITICDMKTPKTLFWSFWKNLLQSVTKRERFTNVKKILQSVTKNYYKVRKNLLQSVKGIARCFKRLLQNVTGIYKIGELLKSETHSINGLFFKIRASSLLTLRQLSNFMQKNRKKLTWADSKILRCERTAKRPNERTDRRTEEQS